SVQVIEGDAPDPRACSLLGKCRITKLPADLPKGSPIEVTYSFNASGRIAVRASDPTGGRVAGIEIDRRGGLNEKEIDAFRVLAEQYQVD
ncbi:MAG TPA: heat-shock protein Hsp70, partial [Planctomycetaceae bacterium]|nr:heat-shock protein Hsp70 [Planctomycetaceae bacterium]